MSAGNPIVKARIPRRLLDELYTTIVEYNFRHPKAKTNVSQFIVKAIREKIAHLKRSNRPKKKADDDSNELCNFAEGTLEDTQTGEVWKL